MLVSDTPSGAVGLRAAELARRMPRDQFSVRVVYRDRGNWRAVWRFMAAIITARPALVCLHNVSWAGAIVAFVAKRVFRRRLVVEVGDPLVEHFRNAGCSALVTALVGRVERMMLSTADEVVVRGSWLADYFQRQGVSRTYHWLPDGVDLQAFRPIPPDEAKRAVGVSGKYVVGTVGRLAWNATHAIGYGWDIIEAIARIPDDDVVALIVGDGDGLEQLKRLATERGVAHRVRFPGWVRHDEVPLFVNAMDLCVSTQTNDPVGWGRTTAKLPEFMACSRTILATDVGEAATLLKGSGQLLRYEGMRDDGYPARLAERIQQLRACPAGGDVADRNRELAERLFDYDGLAARLATVFDAAMRDAGSS